MAISICENLLQHGLYFEGVGGDVFVDDKVTRMSFFLVFVLFARTDRQRPSQDKMYMMKSGTMEDLSFPTERVLKVNSS